MSRRRGPAPERAERGWTRVPVVCTSRRRHGRHSFGAVSVHEAAGMTDTALRPSSSFMADPAGTALARGDVPTVEDMEGTHKTYVFTCPRCRAEYRLTRDRLEAVARGLAATRRPVVELSALSVLPAIISE